MKNINIKNNNKIERGKPSDLPKPIVRVFGVVVSMLLAVSTGYVVMTIIEIIK